MDPTITVESSAIIGRSVDDAWALVSDPRNEPRWHTDIVDIRSAVDPAGGPPTRWILGSTWIVTVQFMWRQEAEVEITGLEANHRIQFTTRTGPMRPIATYRFEAADGGTRFTRRIDMPLSRPMRIFRPLMRRQLQKRNARFVQNLKQLLEA